ncbi:hypothetical protein ACFOHY_25105 [Rhizobium rosettiformans]
MSGGFRTGALPALPVFILLEDTSRTAERPDCCNCGRASLLRWTSWA